MSLTTALVAACVLLGAGLLWQIVSGQRLRRSERRLREELAGGFDRQRRLERTSAAADERERIFNDLHDDIGAKLLNLIYTAEKPAQADLARSVLQDLRDVVTRSRGTPGTLLDVLSDIRAESEQRLAALGVALAWQQDDTLPDPSMDHAQALHLYRIVREALTNALRHARPQRMRIRARHAAPELLLDVTDEGGEGGEDAVINVGAGRGTTGMQERAAELQGSIAWSPGTQGGTKVVLRFPLPR